MGSTATSLHSSTVKQLLVQNSDYRKSDWLLTSCTLNNVKRTTIIDIDIYRFHINWLNIPGFVLGLRLSSLRLRRMQRLMNKTRVVCYRQGLLAPSPSPSWETKQRLKNWISCALVCLLPPWTERPEPAWSSRLPRCPSLCQTSGHRWRSENTRAASDDRQRT